MCLQAEAGEIEPPLGAALFSIRILSDNRKMDERIMQVFMMELVAQGEAMSITTGQYSDALHALRQPDMEHHSQNMGRVFLSAQAILTIGALVSKMLMITPPKPRWCRCDLPAEEQEKHNRAKQRCKELKKALGIKGELPPALNSRRVRNSFEHFDNQLDSFFAEDPHANYFDRNIGPPNMIVVDGGEPRYMRHLDDTTNTVTVLDDSIALHDVADAVIDVANRARQWLNQHGMPI